MKNPLDQFDDASQSDDAPESSVNPLDALDDKPSRAQAQPTEASGSNPLDALDDRPESSMLGAAARQGAQAVLPAIGAVPGFQAGQAIGEIAGRVLQPAVRMIPYAGPVLAPFTPKALGLAGGFVGGAITSDAVKGVQDDVLRWLGLKDDAQDKADKQEHGNVSLAAELAPNLLTFGAGAASKAARAAGAAIFAAPEAARQYESGEFDPTKLAISAGAGALSAAPTKFGRSLMEASDAGLAKVGIRVPGRPDIKAPEDPQAIPTQDAKAEMETTAEAPKPNTPVATEAAPPREVEVGDPQNKVTGSETRYPSGEAADQVTSEPTPKIDTDPIAKDTAAAVKGDALEEAPQHQVADDTAAAMSAISEEHGGGNNTQNSEGINSLTGSSPEPAKSENGAQAAQAAPVDRLGAAPGVKYIHPDYPVTVDHTSNVSGASLNKHGNVVYIPRNVPPTIDVAGKPLNPALPLAVRALGMRKAIEGGLNKDEAMTVAANGEFAWLNKNGYDPMEYMKVVQNKYKPLDQKPGESGPVGTASEPTSAENPPVQQAPEPPRYKAGTVLAVREPSSKRTIIGNKSETYEQIAARAGVRNGVRGVMQKGKFIPGEAEQMKKVTAAVTPDPNAPVKPSTIENTAKKYEAAGQDNLANVIRKEPTLTPGEVRRLANSDPESGKLSTVASRVRSTAPVNEVTGASAGTEAEAAANAKSLNAIRQAHDEFGVPDQTRENPATPEGMKAIFKRLKDGLAAARKADGGKDPLRHEQPNDPSYQWLSGAKRVLSGKADDAEIKTFLGNEYLWQDEASRGLPQQTKLGETEGAAQAPVGEEVENIPSQAKTPEELLAAKQDEGPSFAAVDHETVPPSKTGQITDRASLAASEKPARPKLTLKPKAKPVEDGLLTKGLGDEIQRVKEEALNEKAESTAAEQVKSFTGDESGAVKLPTLPKEAKPNTAGYRARTAHDWYDEYTDSVDDRLHQMSQRDAARTQQLAQIGEKAKAEFPNEMKEKPDQEIYLAREDGTIGSLSAAKQKFYNTILKPLYDRAERLFLVIKKYDPDIESKVNLNHVSRMTEEGNPKYSGVSADPVEGITRGRQLNTSTGPLKDRVFMALVDAQGNRIVVSEGDTPKTLLQWNKYNTNELGLGKKSKLKVGDQIVDDQGNTYTVDNARTPEIEANASDASGKPMKYIKSAWLSAVHANLRLYSVAQHLKFLEDMKNKTQFKRLATTDFATAREKGWEKVTSMPLFKDYYMDPRLKAVFDNYSRPGFEGNAYLDQYRDLSTAVTKLMFWNPVPHALNVALHWFVGRGFDWIKPKAYFDLAMTGHAAIKSVVTQDAWQMDHLRQGMSGIYTGVLNKNASQNFGRQIGKLIEDNPGKFEAIAKTWGLGSPFQLAKGVYRASSKTMWAVNDVLLTQRVMELERRGMKTDEAIKDAERHIPNYRLPPNVMGSPAFTKFLAETAFGRYHFGMFNSYAHIVKGLVAGNTEQRIEAAGNLLAAGFAAYVIYPQLDRLARFATGNPDAEQRRRGPLAIPHALIQAAQGKADLAQALHSSLTIPPLVSTALEAYNNKDFAGRNIVEPGNIDRMINAPSVKQKVAAGVRAAGQEAGHLARGLISPYGTAANAFARGENPLKTVGEQLGDIRDPTPKTRKWMHQNRSKNLRMAQRRTQEPRDPIEAVTNKLSRF